MATVDYGTDLNFADLDISETGDMVSGFDLLAQAVLIRLSTGRTVIDAPEDGIDLTDYLSRGMTAAQLASLKSTIESEILKDERFLAARATVTTIGATAEEIHVSLELDTDAGPFTLVLGAAEAGVAILGGA